jgi:hypothetical protein
MNRAYGAAALVRLIDPDCECKSGAAPERISKGMYPRGALRLRLPFFFFSFLLVRGKFLRVTMLWRYLSPQMTCPQLGRKPVWRTHGWQKKKGGGVIEFGGSGSAPGPIQGREWTHPKKRRRSVLATGVNKTSLPNMNW